MAHGVYFMYTQPITIIKQWLLQIKSEIKLRNNYKSRMCFFFNDMAQVGCWHGEMRIVSLPSWKACLSSRCFISMFMYRDITFLFHMFSCFLSIMNNIELLVWPFAGFCCGDLQNYPCLSYHLPWFWKTTYWTCSEAIQQVNLQGG